MENNSLKCEMLWAFARNFTKGFPDHKTKEWSNRMSTEAFIIFCNVKIPYLVLKL